MKQVLGPTERGGKITPKARNGLENLRRKDETAERGRSETYGENYATSGEPHGANIERGKVLGKGNGKKTDTPTRTVRKFSDGQWGVRKDLYHEREL